MSVNIRIMQKGFFRRKKFIIDDVVKLSHLSFGVMDENLVLCQDLRQLKYLFF